MGYEATQFYPLLEDLVPLRVQPLRYGFCEHLDTLSTLPAFYRDAIERLRLKPKPESTADASVSTNPVVSFDQTDDPFATQTEWV